VGQVNLRKVAKGKNCSVCGADDGTIVLAHLRLGFNSGVGIKPPDHHAMYACFSCHSYIDGEGRGDYKIMLGGYLRQIDKWTEEGVITWAK